MNEAGSLYPGNRAIAKRCDTSKNTAQRRIAKLVDTFKLVSRTKRGGHRTDHYQILDPALIKFLIAAWDVYHPNWRDYRRRPSAAVAQAFLAPLGEPTFASPESGPKGNPYSPYKSPATLPTEPRARASKAPSAQAEAPHPDPSSSAQAYTPTAGSTVKRGEGADGSAAPRLLPSRKAADMPAPSWEGGKPSGIADTSRAALDRADSTTPLPVREIADVQQSDQPRSRLGAGARLPDSRGRRGNRRGERALRSVDRGNVDNQRSQLSENHSTPRKVLIYSWAAENLDLFIGEYGTEKDRLAYWRGDSETIYRFTRWKNSINWKPPPEVRARHKLHKRASGVDRAERERRLHLQAMGISNRLPSRISQTDFWAIVAAKIAGNKDAQIVYDKLASLVPAKPNTENWPGGRKNRQNSRSADSGFYGRLGFESRKVRENDPCEPVASAPRAKISGANPGEFFHNRSYATRFEALEKSTYSTTRSLTDDHPRTLTNEALTWSANTNVSVRYATSECEPRRAQTGVREQCATSDPGSGRGYGETRSQAWLRSGSARAELAQDQVLSRGGLVGDDGAPRAPGAGGGLNFQPDPPPAGGGGGGRTFASRICENSQKAPQNIKNFVRRRPKFQQIEGLPPSTYLVPR